MSRKRHIVTIEEDVSEIGAITENWVRRGRLYANVTETGGGEMFRGVQLEADVACVVDVNHRDWITPQMRLTHNGERLNIKAAIDRQGRKRDLELHCSRIADDG